MLDTDSEGDVKSTWLVSFFTLVSRVLGYARLIILVWIFGSTRWASDAFIFAFRIPNLFRNLLGEGALSAAFIPVFVKTDHKEGKASAGQLGGQALTALTLVGGLIAVVGILVCLALDLIWAGNREVSLALRLTALFFPFMPLVCLAALLGGMLNGMKRFALPAALSIILNLGFLAGFAYVYWWQCGGDLSRLQAEGGTYAVAIFVLLAGLLEVVVQFPALRAAGLPIAFSLRFNHPGLKATLTAFAPAALGLGLVQINAFVDSLIAGALSLSSPGAVTYLEIGVRFMQLPLGVFGVAIATVSFPAFAAASAAGDDTALFRRLVKAVRMSLFLILPSAAVLVAMADPIIRLTFQRPDLNFGHAAVYRSALTLMIYSCGLMFFSFRQILVRAFYARGDYGYPVKVSVAMVVLNLCLNLTLIYFPDLYRYYAASGADWQFFDYLHMYHVSPSAFPGGFRLNEAGLALATLITAVVDSTLLARGLWRRIGPHVGGPALKAELPALRNTFLRMLVASLAVGILTWLYRNSIPYDPRFLLLLERVAVPCLLACVTFYIIGVILPLPEMKEFLFAPSGKKKAADKETGQA